VQQFLQLEQFFLEINIAKLLQKIVMILTFCSTCNFISEIHGFQRYIKPLDEKAQCNLNTEKWLQSVARLVAR
jgi:hypothetical protein